jgi:hypothetical protein
MRGLLAATRARAVGVCLGVVLCLAACYGPAYDNGGLRCAQGLCPEGYYCAADTDHCWRNGTVPPLADGAAEEATRPPDAGTEAGVVLDADLDRVPEPDAEPPDPDVPADPLARLMSMTVEPGQLDPPFMPANRLYELSLPLFTPAVTVTAVAENPDADLAFKAGAAHKGSLMTTLPLSPGRTDFSVEVAGATSAKTIYRVTVNAGGDLTYVKAPNTHAAMAFGTSMAVASNLLVVGAPADRSSALGPQTGETPPGTVETGAVFVYARTGTTWRREVTLKPSHLNPGMRFGASVAIMGTGDVIVVGAPGESGNGLGINPMFVEGAAQEAGAAFVFVRGPANTWVQQAYLKASDTATGDLFGSSVAVTQSVAPAPALTTIAVGAPGASGAGGSSPHTGAVYVFVRAGATGPWTQQAMPHPTNPKGNNEFGTSVSLSGESLVVGAPREDSGASGVNPGQTSATAGNSGAAYIFTRNGTTWPQPVYVKAPVALTNAEFGTRVAIAGMFMAVAAPRDPGSWRGIDQSATGPPNATDSGAVFLYHRNGNTWTLLHQIKAGMPHNSDFFGSGLGLSLGGTLVVGAPGDDASEGGALDPTNALEDSGAIYVFRPETSGRWSQVARLKAPNAEAKDAFGGAVASDGDTVVAGAVGEASSAINVDGRLSDNGALGSGAVYLY